MPQPCVAFLRAVNVGGRNRVPQRPLAERLERDLGVTVRHLLQSGNLVIADGDPVGLGSEIAAAISADTGLAIDVIVRTVAQLASNRDANPWPDDDPKQVHLALWDGDAGDEALTEVSAADWRGDEFRPVPGGAWLHFAGPSHESKLGATFARRLKVVATTRNARTVADVLALARSF